MTCAACVCVRVCVGSGKARRTAARHTYSQKIEVARNGRFGPNRVTLSRARTSMSERISLTASRRASPGSAPACFVAWSDDHAWRRRSKVDAHGRMGPVRPTAAMMIGGTHAQGHRGVCARKLYVIDPSDFSVIFQAPLKGAHRAAFHLQVSLKYLYYLKFDAFKRSVRVVLFYLGTLLCLL